MDSAVLDRGVSLEWFREVVVVVGKGVKLHGLSGAADASGDIVAHGLRCGTDVVYHGCFRVIAQILRDRGVRN